MKRIEIMLICGLLLCVSCKKFLEEDSRSLITLTEFYGSDADAIAAVNGVYQAMRTEVIDMYTIQALEMISDDGILSPTNIGSRMELENLTYTSQHFNIKSMWSTPYRVIERANNVIAYAKDSSKISPKTIRRVQGEARFLRAFYYFRLVQLFGDVPLMTDPASVDPDNLRPARTTAADVYKKIIEDLQYAEVNLDDAYGYNDSNGGRATKAAAKALLGKVYLAMAGYPLKDGAKYQLAADKLKELIDNKAVYKTDLNTNYANIFSTAASNKSADKERIFYTKGTSGMPANALAYTRMKYNYVYSPTMNVSPGFSMPYIFTASANGYSELVDGIKVPAVQADDVISAALPIGFTFRYGGWPVDKFYMSSNGFISFVSRVNTAPILNVTKDQVIAPLIDNLNGTGGEASYATSGTAPDRVLTVQWKNWRWKTGTTIGNNISFQLKLYEADGKIQMIYNQTGDPVNNGIAAVGMRTNSFFCSISNSATSPDFNWVSGTSAVSTSVKRFQPGQVFTITPNPQAVYEWADPRMSVNVNSTNRVSKYNDELTSSVTDNADDFIWLRYSDVLLMYAEALTNLGGAANTDLALLQLNQIRQAHGGTSGSPTMPLLPDLTYNSPEELQHLIRLERRRELAFECHRWFDLKRWGLLPGTIRAHLADEYSMPESEFSYVNDNMNLLPIPYSDIANNPNLIQNPGY